MSGEKKEKVNILKRKKVFKEEHISLGYGNSISSKKLSY